MASFIIGIFFILHGLVHLLYAAQSQRQFELRPGMLWPDGSWAFSKLLGDNVTRWLASIACLVSAIGFMAGGLGLILGQAWWQPVVVGAVVFSSLIFVLFWDGKRQKLDDPGGVGLLINLAILGALIILQWTTVGS